VGQKIPAVIPGAVKQAFDPDHLPGNFNAEFSHGSAQAAAAGRIACIYRCFVGIKGNLVLAGRQIGTVTAVEFPGIC
jgi:hypothetical protein